MLHWFPLHRVLAMTSLLLFLAAGWWGTWIWGVDDVTKELCERGYTNFAPHGTVTLSPCDPDDRNCQMPPMPWFYVGKPTVPLPFMVAIDSKYQAAPLAGQGDRYYCLWFVGWWYPIHQHTYWSS